MPAKRNPNFWRFARYLARRPGALTLALVMAFVSAGGLGAGLLGVVSVLRIVFEDEGATLALQAQRLTENYPVAIPQAWLGALPTEPMTSVAWMLGALSVLAVFGAAANFFHEYISYTLTAQTVADIRRRAFRQLLHAPLEKVAGDSSDPISRILADTHQLQNGLSTLTSRVVAQITRASAALVAAFLINWRLTLIALLVAPILYTVIRKLGKRIRKASHGMLRARARLLRVSSESLQGLRTVKAYAAETAQLGEFSRHNREALREELRARTARALASPATELIGVIALSVLAYIAARAIIFGQLDPGAFMGVLGALGIAGGALKPISGFIQNIQAADAAAMRIAEVLDQPTEPVRPSPRLPRLPRHARSIQFENIAYTYPGADVPAVQGVDLEIPHAQTVAFVGPNGCGKTTLLSMIPRLLVPQQGRILIDDADIFAADLRSVRRQVGVVSQDVVLFGGTIRDNITFGAVGVTEEMIQRAARAARAEGFILDKPGGYEAVLGEGGVSLSGGQRQRLAIARAILRDPAILILDEATSMIDAESEQKINEAIAEFSQGRTCLIVAHRLSTVRNADRIVVMDRGRIVDTGAHDELLARCDTYRRIAAGQLVPAPA